MSTDTDFKIELIGEERQRLEVKAALLAVETIPVVVVESATGIPLGEEDASRVDLTIAIVEDDSGPQLSMLRSRSERQDVPLFALLREPSVAAMRRALRQGADELLFRPLDSGNLTRALLGVSEASRRAKKKNGGIICSLVSNTGGVGVTTLAANLGLALRYSLKKEVAFVDLHLQGGGLAVALDLSPSQGIMALGQTQRKLDSAALSAVLIKHASDAYLLAGPSGIEESELITEETVAAVLEVISELFNFVIVDCGSYIDAKTLAVWERSDYLFYVLEQSVIATRSAGRFLDLLTRMDRRQIEPAFILNKYVADYQIGEQQLVDALKEPIFARIPRDYNTLDRIQLTGSDLWRVAPKSELTQAFVSLAARVAEEPEHSEMEIPEGFVSKLMTKKWRGVISSLPLVGN